MYWCLQYLSVRQILASGKKRRMHREGQMMHKMLKNVRLSLTMGLRTRCHTGLHPECWMYVFVSPTQTWCDPGVTSCLCLAFWCTKSQEGQKRNVCPHLFAPFSFLFSSMFSLSLHFVHLILLMHLHRQTGKEKTSKWVREESTLCASIPPLDVCLWIYACVYMCVCCEKSVSYDISLSRLQ